MLKRILQVYEEEGIQGLASRLLDKFLRLKILSPLAYRISMHKLEERKAEESSLGDILDTAFNYRGVGVFRSLQPAQVPEEIKELSVLVEKVEPKTIMEIGTSKGGTFYIFTRYLDSASLLISLDLPGGSFGGGYTESHLSLFNDFDREKDLRFIRKDSHQKSTKEEVEIILGEKEIDFLFIDGDHSYKGVKSDFEMYSPLVSENGIIAFHDIVTGPKEIVGGVPEFWNEIKGSFHTREIVDNRQQKGFGIGVLFK